ncbi:hypothetical protein GNP94_03130 [Paenibacillus campinasensis]|uniref:DUF4825 domain-containing protein n=1 Tax=Paenibacillus campinasensis TaxID=66347 RepID=A0ABW9SVJ0_9BACL|nr:hypothetical protein [Paenibacillus campinasensis]MUG64998.1 hypothetical protein [Paenibacillus campinasensis]
MKYWKPVQAVVLPASAAMLLLILLLGLFTSVRADSGAAPAFFPRHVRNMSDEILVDALSSLPLHLKISRADWDGGALMVDLQMPERNVAVRDIYEDVTSLFSYSFEGTDNVEQLFLRVMAVDRWGGKRYLLLASDMRRSEWQTSYEEALLNLEDGRIPEPVLSSLHLTVTNLWEKQFIGR